MFAEMEAVLQGVWTCTAGLMPVERWVPSGCVWVRALTGGVAQTSAVKWK